MLDAEELKRRLEQIGEAEVRERQASGVYGAQEMSIVDEWLSSKERERKEKEAEQHVKIAKSAKSAAWVAAIASLISALAAIAAWMR